MKITFDLPAEVESELRSVFDNLSQSADDRRTLHGLLGDAD